MKPKTTKTALVFVGVLGTPFVAVLGIVGGALLGLSLCLRLWWAGLMGTPSAFKGNEVRNLLSAPRKAGDES